MNEIKFASAWIGALAGFLWRQLDGLLLALIAFMVLDYITGVIVGAVRHTLDSAVGFTGIARTNTRGYTHVDVRSGHWYGDETVSMTKTATDDFYKYFGIQKPEQRVLKRGDSGDDVLRLQGVLAGLGYYGGELDGKYGKQTLGAVLAFQLENGLDVDGVCGSATRAALMV